MFQYIWLVLLFLAYIASVYFLFDDGSWLCGIVLLIPVFYWFYIKFILTPKINNEEDTRIQTTKVEKKPRYVSVMHGKKIPYYIWKRENDSLEVISAFFVLFILVLVCTQCTS